MTLTTKVFVVLFIAFALAGCGQSGALYIPGDPTTVKETPARQVPIEESEEKNENEES